MPGPLTGCKDIRMSGTASLAIFSKKGFLGTMLTIKIYPGEHSSVTNLMKTKGSSLIVVIVCFHHTGWDRSQFQGRMDKPSGRVARLQMPLLFPDGVNL